MLFPTWAFARFFLVVVLVYWMIPWRRLRWSLPLPGGRRFILTGDEVRIGWIVAASFYFYAQWSRTLAVLVVVTTLIDYAIGLGLETLTAPRKRRALIVLSLVINLGMLCYFKYANFFLDSLREALGPLVTSGTFRPLEVLATVGISFYTFEAINYTVDVYCRRIPAERNPLHLLCFVLFFPHLVAGPIVRARDFLPQMQRSKRWSWGRLQLGGEYFLIGLLKKWVLADQLAHFADPIFEHPELFNTAASWVSILAFTLQVYCDGSGYADMALGTAHILGYKLGPNYNMPYLATSFSDYWRRQHISLSTWLRDYLYIPLGGSRGGLARTSRNFLITMTLGGLWHGARWNLVVWGLLHGILLSLNRVFRLFCQARPRLDALMLSSGGTVLRWAVTFLVICQGLVVFQAGSWDRIRIYFGNLWTATAGKDIEHPLGYRYFGILVAILVLGHLGACRGWWQRISVRLSAPVLACSYVLLLNVGMALASIVEKPFLYLKF